MENKIIISFFENVKSSGKMPTFLSERFKNYYIEMRKKYPRIELSDCISIDEANLFKKSKLYINDINYELPPRMGIRDNIYTLFKVDYFDSDYPGMTDDDWNKTILYMEKYNIKYYKKIKSMFETDGVNALDFIVKELNYLSDKYDNIIDYSPDFLKNYLLFYQRYNDELYYFISNYFNTILEYKLMFGKEMTDEYRSLLRNKLINDIINKYNVDCYSELIDYLENTDKFNYINMAHTRLKKK